MRSLYYFDIDDELFSELKKNLNRAITSVIAGMQKKNVCEGEVTLSAKVSFAELQVVDANGIEKMITVPNISHKVVTKMSVKDEEKGKIKGIDADRGGFLSLMKINGRYAAVVTPPDASQLTLEDQRMFAGLDEDADDDQ